MGGVPFRNAKGTLACHINSFFVRSKSSADFLVSVSIEDQWFRFFPRAGNSSGEGGTFFEVAGVAASMLRAVQGSNANTNFARRRQWQANRFDLYNYNKWDRALNC